VVEILVFGSLVYFLSGLSGAHHGWYFMCFIAVTFSTALAVGQYFRLVGSQTASVGLGVSHRASAGLA
jgi:hypothetical protein